MKGSSIIILIAVIMIVLIALLIIFCIWRGKKTSSSISERRIMPYNESDVIQTALRKDANPLKTSNRAPLSEEARKKQNATRASVLELQKELTKVGAT